MNREAMYYVSADTNTPNGMRDILYYPGQEQSILVTHPVLVTTTTEAIAEPLVDMFNHLLRQQVRRVVYVEK